MTESGQEHSASTPADRVGDGMTRQKTCLIPHCENKTECRGLCKKHWGGLGQNVRLGKTTWAELETLGLSLPTRTTAGTGRLLDLIATRRRELDKGDGTPDQ